MLASPQLIDGELLSSTNLLTKSDVRERIQRLRAAAIKAMVLEKIRLLWARAHRGVLQRILSGRTMSFTYAESGQLALLREMCDAEERFKHCYTTLKTNLFTCIPNSVIDPVQNLPVFISSVHCNLTSRSAQVRSIPSVNYKYGVHYLICHLCSSQDCTKSGR